ncbi:MAG TPA: NUDIX hydrolase [Bryobacteraceae bacterium]|nr:NUDIX hydrolase [Bryobacteraceae bacterium]
MISRMEAAAVAMLVSGFSDSSDGEALKSRELVLMMLACTPAPFSREQFTPGHVTATGLVLAPDQERVLLVHHRRLDRWLLPGGHIEPDDANPGAAARREVIEETGAVLASDEAPPLASVDVHGIPAKGSEPYHLHHDLIFFFRATEDRLQVSAESHQVAWCHPRDFERYNVPGNVRRAYRRIPEWL